MTWLSAEPPLSLAGTPGGSSLWGPLLAVGIPCSSSKETAILEMEVGGGGGSYLTAVPKPEPFAGGSVPPTFVTVTPPEPSLPHV